MKKIKRTTILLLALMMILVMGQVAFAEGNNLNGGTYSYNGSAITTSNPNAVQDAIAGLEPGDSVTITQTYTNNTDHNTDWYLKNDVINAFESGSEEGGYTYILTAGGQEIFNSEQVGGNNAPSAGGEKGLQLATDATDEWIHIDKLGAKASGTTTLYVALDGESQLNDYQSADARIELQYAVEDEEVGEVIVKHVKGVKTGDDTNILLSIATFLGALLLLILAIISYRKDRKEGEEV